MTDPLSFRAAQEFLPPVLVRLFRLNPQALAGGEADIQPEGFA